MAETNEFPEPSPLAAQRQREMLPGLLAAVRWRRRRKKLVRAAAVASAIVLALVWAARTEPTPPADAPVAASPAWTTFTDDASIVQRCEVAPAVRAEWFVDDAELQHLLATDARSSGVVRIGNHVQVSASAIDPWGSEAADQEPDGGTGS